MCNKMNCMISTVVLPLIFCIVQCINEVPIIQTKFGAISGVFSEDSYGEYYFYMGVPFGRPPKNNPFGDPVDPIPWSGVYAADSDQAKCPQRDEIFHTLVGDPDCLYLNVYVPAKRSSKNPLSVYYWIYGGGNEIGSASRFTWGPELLIRHDIIMVIVNYRLGPYGFMCLGTKEIPGNAGLKDILKGLRWVSDNISAFGGNPKDITIGGSSTGASIVEFLIVSPAATGLFHRGIQQSGSKSINLNYMNYTSHEAVLNLAHYFGYKGDVSRSVEFLKHVEPLILIEAVKKLKLVFKECVEPHFKGVEAFFTQGHTETMVNGNYSGVDILSGMNCKELPQSITESFVEYILNRTSLLFMVNEKDKMQVEKTILNFFKGSKPLEKVPGEISELLSDVMIGYPVYFSLQNMLRKNITAYFYEFCYNGKRNYGKRLKKIINIDGATHADETGYLFNQGYWGKINEKDKIIIDRMTKMWTNFIKYGNPTPETSELLPVKWLPVIKNGLQHYLKIDTHLTMDIDLKHERMAFWKMMMIPYFKIWKV